MPTYIYRCQTCEEEYEIVQSFKDDPIEKCPSDCSGTVKKVFSGVGISFKGSGFYKNDHGSNSKKKPQRTLKTQRTQKKTQRRNPILLQKKQILDPARRKLSLQRNLVLLQLD